MTLRKRCQCVLEHEFETEEGICLICARPREVVGTPRTPRWPRSPATSLWGAIGGSPGNWYCMYCRAPWKEDADVTHVCEEQLRGVMI